MATSFSSRADCVRARARLINDPEFGKALVNGEMQARDAIKEISEYLIANGGGALDQAELKVTGFE